MIAALFTVAAANVQSDFQLTSKDWDDVLTIDRSVLDTPLSPAELADARANVERQAAKNPDAFAKSMDRTRKFAEVLRHGSDGDKLQVRTLLWTSWLEASNGNPSAAWWVSVVKRHSPPIAQANGQAVTNRQLDALFVSNDWVAHTAGLPTSTPETRYTFAQAVSKKFGALPKDQQDELANADKRWFCLYEPILDHSDLRAKAESIVKSKVHGQPEVGPTARSLENEGLKFHALMAQFVHNMGKIAGVDAQRAQIEGINFASRKFLGMGH